MFYFLFIKSVNQYSKFNFKNFINTSSTLMEVQNLQLSNIAQRQDHYLHLKNPPTFYFEHQPVTHNLQKNNLASEKKLLKQKQIKQRRQLIQKSQRIKKQLLLQKIASKNYRYELRQNVQKGKLWQKQNKELYQTANLFRPSKNPFQKLQAQQNQKTNLDVVQKIYLKNPKVPFSSTKGFNSVNKQKTQFMRKTSNVNFKSMQKQPNQDNKKIQIQYNESVPKDQNQNIPSQKGFKQIKLKSVRLPELNYAKQKSSQLNQDPCADKIIQKKLKKNKKQKSSQQKTNSVLKTHPTRYFGIQQNITDYQKICKDLLKTIKSKYWSYDDISTNADVIQSFQNYLAQQLM